MWTASRPALSRSPIPRSPVPRSPVPRSAALAGGTALALALALAPTAASAGPAGPAAPPTNVRFLDAAHWQAGLPGTGAWTAGEIRPGRRSPTFYCVNEPLPVDRTSYRDSDGDHAHGFQHVTAQPSAAAAERLVAGYVRHLRSCLTKWWDDTGTVRIKQLGSYPRIKDGLVVIGVFHRYDKDNLLFAGRAASDLFAVGRDGKLVTTLELDLWVPRKTAPVAQFTALAKTGLRQLVS